MAHIIVQTVSRSTLLDDHTDGVDADVLVNGAHLGVTLVRARGDAGKTWTRWGCLDNWISDPTHPAFNLCDEGGDVDEDAIHDLLREIEDEVENAALAAGLD